MSSLVFPQHAAQDEKQAELLAQSSSLKVSPICNHPLMPASHKKLGDKDFFELLKNNWL
jgi:hypothetical protein